MLEVNGIKITDPVYDPDAKIPFPSSLFENMVKDRRDLPFVQLAIKQALFFVPASLFLIFSGMFEWWMAAIYWVVYLLSLGPFILMLHNTSHRQLFKKEYKILNYFIPWVIGPHVGQPPESYFAHHLGMHHKEGNLPDDLSSTMKYQRDSFIDFLRYYFSFLFVGTFELIGYLKRKHPKLLKRMFVGEGVWYLVATLMTIYNWKAGLTIYFGPLIMTRFLLMAGNWTQHAFVDPEDWDNDYRTVVTFINSPYNHSCFNDGYHLGHHLKSSRHWLDMPQDFVDKQEEILKHQSFVFRKIDYFMMWVMLMTKRYKLLASFMVDLDPERSLTIDEKVDLIKRRLKRFNVKELVQTDDVVPAAAE